MLFSIPGSLTGQGRLSKSLFKGTAKIDGNSKLVTPKKDSEWRQVWRHLRKNRLAMVGLAIMTIFILCAIFAPFLTPHDPIKTDLGNAFIEPSGEHPLGTDWLGRDNFSRILYGSRISLAIGLVCGKFDLVIQRIIDILIAFPGILLAIVVVTVLGVGVENVMIAVGIASVPIYTRLVRGSVLALKEQGYVAAARALGIGDGRIIIRHIMPNCLGPIIVQSTFQIATAILWAAGLGFLGLGAQPPDPEWGAMLSKGREYIRTAHYLTTYPGLAILLMVLGFNLIGDGMRDALDPRSRKHR